MMCRCFLVRIIFTPGKRREDWNRLVQFKTAQLWYLLRTADADRPVNWTWERMLVKSVEAWRRE